MESKAFVQRRLIMLADPALGVVAPSWRAREALVEAGHVVFWFTPALWPQLFCDGVARLDFLAALIGRWHVDAVIAADGLGADARGLTDDLPRVIALAATDDELDRTVERTQGAAIDAAWVLGAWSESERTVGDRVVPVSALALDPGCEGLTLANDIAYERGVVCVQDATDERIRALQALLDVRGGEVPVRCLGAGWPALWRFDAAGTGAAYALGSSSLFVRFAQQGVEDPLGSYYAGCFAALGGDAVLTLDVTAVDDPDVDAAVPCSPWHPERTFERSVVDALDASLVTARPQAPAEPARIATVLGYVGRGNFGDEYILSTIAERLERRCSGTVTVAVSEDPWHTLVNRGVYAVGLADKRVLDGVLARSSVALVMAGLLFDQGIRWTMGKAELLSSVLHSDIPGIAAFAQLAHVNDVPVALYGIGAGPLERAHSKVLVRLMGDMGARFICRDEHTADLIEACGVDGAQVARRADVAFTAERHFTATVDAWLANQELDAGATELIAVSLRDYENVSADFADRVARALDAVLADRRRAHAVFCILDAADRQISDAVIARMKHIDRVHTFDAGNDIDAMADLLGVVSAGLSMRYHCSLLLFRGKIPCVGLGYLPKVQALYREAGMEESLLDMDASADELEEALERVLERHDELAEALETGVAGLVERATQGEDELVELLEGSAPACERGADTGELYLYATAASDRALGEERAARAAAEERAAAAERELAEARERIRALEESNSYKIGSAITYLPGLLKHRGR